MSTDTSVKIFSSAMASGPTLSNTAGYLIALLDACLVNGFGSMTASSAVVADGVCTLTFGSSHSFIVGAVATVAGVTTSGYTGLNADQKVTAITSNTVSFATDLADATSLDGTITAMIAPAGWSKAFSGTNLAAYKSSAEDASGMYLYVNDTTAAYASVRGYEDMTDIETGTGIFPTTSQATTSVWQKSNSSSTVAWKLFANDRFFYFFVAPSSSYTTQFLGYCFGDFVPRRSGDAYRVVLGANNTTTLAMSYTYQPVASLSLVGNAVLYVPRSYSTLSAPMSLSRWWSVPGNTSGLSGAAGWVFPNAPDNGILFAQIQLQESSSVRGELPGIYACPQVVSGGILNGQIYTPSEIERALMFQWAGDTPGGVFIDVTGPWDA